jgi:hypothetical protein
MNCYYDTIILRDDGKDGEVEIYVRASYAYHPACRGQRDSLGGKRGAGPPLEPDEPAYVEVEQVFALGEDGKVGPELDDLTDSEREKIEGEIMEQIAARESDYPEE